MAQAVVVAAIAAGKITAGTTAAVLATTAAAVVDLAITSSYQKKKAADAQKDAASAPRDVTIRSAIEPARIIYGKARTSGPVVYTNTQPTPGTNDNSTLWTAISLANHECESIEEIWLDGDQILWSQLSGTGGVTSGKYGLINTNEVTNFYAKLGTPSQTALSELVSAFSDWTSSYTGQDITYLVSAFELGTATGEGVWAQGAPNNIRAVVKGKKVYDPRKDSTNGGSGLHRLADPTTWEWSDNPALCLADYLFDDRLGLGAEGVTYNDIDWSMVAEAAQWCDAPVDTIYEMDPDSIPTGGSTKRFTCNGVLSTGATYADNIRTLVSSMNGMLTWTGGKYRIRACAYEAPTYSFTEDDIVGDIQVQPERTRSQRFNTIRGTYIDPESDYNSTEFIPVTNSSYQTTRDGGQKLTTDIALPMTNDEYMAQRIAYKALNLNNQQTTAVIPLNWKALKVGVGDRIQVTVSELSWPNKIFLVEGWSFEPDKGFLLNVKEDSLSAYADPSLSDYSTRTLAGTVTFADQPVAAPSGLQATSEEEAILLEWEAPPRGSGYDEVVIYASVDSSWANASEVGRTRSTSFRHELARGTTRYYWIRSVDVDGEFSIRDPDSDTSTVTATAGQIATSQLDDDANFALTADWPSVTDSLGTAPDDNATVGSTLGTNTFDTDGSTVMGANELRNSVNKGKTIALLLNKDSAGNSNPGEGGLVGVDNEGAPVLSTDGFIVWNGASYTVPAKITPASSTSFLTQLAGKKGYLVYDINSASFTVAGVSTRLAFVYKESGAWYYDNNSATPVSLTPTDNHLAIAYIETGAADSIQRGGLLAEPVQLLALSEIVADYISAGTIDASVINVTNLSATNITSGTISTSRLDVNDIINAGSIIVANDNISSLTNDAAFINGSQVNANVTSISGGAITTGTVSAARIDVSGVITAGSLIVSGDNISSLTNNAGYVDSSGAAAAAPVQSVAGATGNVPVSTIISAGSIVVTGDNVSALTNDSGFINGGQVNSNVTSISGGVITTGTVLAARLDVAGIISAGGIIVGGDNITSLTNNAGYVDSSGAAAAAPVQSVAGATGNVPVSTIISAGSIVVTGDNVSSLTNDSGFINGGQVNANVTSISGGAITTGTVAANRIDVSGVISAGGIIVSGDNITSLTNNAGYVNSSGAAAAAPVQSVAGATGNVSVSTIISAGSIVVTGDNVSALTNDSGFINGGQVNANVTSISGGAITTGTVAANRIDVSGVISAGGIIVSGDNISALTNNAGYINGSQVNSNVTSISGGVITTGTVNADRISIDGITLSRSGGNLIIKNGGVDTTQIQVNAVTQEEVDFNSSTSATSILNNLSSGYNLSNIKASVTITTEGGPVDLFSSFEWAASAFYTNTYTAIQMWLYRKTGGVATLIYSTYNPYIHKSMGAQIGIAYVDTPAAGTYTYELHLGRPVSYTVYGRFPYIRALELKR